MLLSHGIKVGNLIVRYGVNDSLLLHYIKDLFKNLNDIVQNVSFKLKVLSYQRYLTMMPLYCDYCSSKCKLNGLKCESCTFDNIKLKKLADYFNLPLTSRYLDGTYQLGKYQNITDEVTK